VAISDLNVVIFAGQPARLADKLPVGSGRRLRIKKFMTSGFKIRKKLANFTTFVKFVKIH